jgi:hypothetical protein
MIQSRTSANVKQALRRLLTVSTIAMVSLISACAENSVTNPGVPGADGATHPGFDTSLYPGDATMAAWRKPSSPYEWVGYYLEAPCHRDPSWMGRRAALTSMGWGLAVLYVGQQTFDGVPIVENASPSRQTPLARSLVIDPIPANDAALLVTCSRTLLTTEQGTTDAIDAAAKTASEGFPNGTTIFLDIEHMDAIPASMEAYYRAWVKQVLADGRFRPGIYVHKANADAIHAGVGQAYADMHASGSAQFWLTGSTGFDLSRSPRESGFSFANVWQGIYEVDQTWNGATINIDVDVADRSSPSAP